MILTVTLNVSVDKAYIVDSFEEGKVNRVLTCSNTAGGKGLNIAKVVKLCGEKVLATGFLGGHNGAYIEDMLNEGQVPNRFVNVKSETRSCINILAKDGSSTELLEPGAVVTEEEIAEFLEEFKILMDKSDVVTISGSVPKGVGTDIYKKLIYLCKENHKKVILDTSGELLKEGIQACPTMIKPNSDEIEALLGISIHNREEVIANAKKLQSMGIEVVVVSLGGDGALVVTKDEVLHGQPPKIDVVNTVGCGDSMVAAFAVGFQRGYTLEETLKYAIAISAANAMTMVTGHFEPEVMEEIKNSVKIMRM